MIKKEVNFIRKIARQNEFHFAGAIRNREGVPYKAERKRSRNV
jgi:hypothetical protein